MKEKFEMSIYRKGDSMNDILRELLLNGFMIYPNDGKFIVKKEPVPSNPTAIKETCHDSYELAIEAAESMLNVPQLVDWLVIARYNRGLGIEYKNLPNVQAANKQQAKALAESLAEEILGNVVISEIKVCLKI